MDRLSWWLVRAALAGALAAGCGHTEDEWQAKVHELDDVKTRLDAEQTQAKKSRSELDESTARNEQLKQQLKTAGVDVSNLNANLETQGRALDELRRRTEQIAASKRRFDLLRSKLSAFAKQGLEVTVRNNRIVIMVPGDSLFGAGHETLKREGHDLLLKVAEVVRSDPSLSARAFQVVGHVDATPSGGRFKDAFGLSLMQAREVLALLVQPADKGGGGLSASRWSAAGYGDVDPLKSNDTPDGKQANRRCELVIQPGPDEVLDLKALTQ